MDKIKNKSIKELKQDSEIAHALVLHIRDCAYIKLSMAMIGCFLIYTFNKESDLFTGLGLILVAASLYIDLITFDIKAFDKETPK